MSSLTSANNDSFENIIDPMFLDLLMAQHGLSETQARGLWGFLRVSTQPTLEGDAAFLEKMGTIKLLHIVDLHRLYGAGHQKCKCEYGHAIRWQFNLQLKEADGVKTDTKMLCVGSTCAAKALGMTEAERAFYAKTLKLCQKGLARGGYDDLVKIITSTYTKLGDGAGSHLANEAAAQRAALPGIVAEIEKVIANFSDNRKAIAKTRMSGAAWLLDHDLPVPAELLRKMRSMPVTKERSYGTRKAKPVAPLFAPPIPAQPTLPSTLAPAMPSPAPALPTPAMPKPAMPTVPSTPAMPTLTKMSTPAMPSPAPALSTPPPAMPTLTPVVSGQVVAAPSLPTPMPTISVSSAPITAPVEAVMQCDRRNAFRNQGLLF